jgi:hypothetical protein
MKEIHGDLWDFHSLGHYICITTNGAVRRDGACVMGRGIAKQAAQRFPRLPYDVGKLLKSSFLHPMLLPEYRLVTFPVKHHWSELADLQLIENSATWLMAANTEISIPAFAKGVYLPRPGCGNGGLTWDVVRPVIAPILDDRFTVVEINP